MNVTQRIPTSQFAYVEFNEEYDSIEDAMADHKRILKLYENKDGLNASQWKAVRLEMLNTGNVDVNLLDEMSDAQRWWVNETKKSLRDIKNQEQTTE